VAVLFAVAASCQGWTRIDARNVEPGRAIRVTTVEGEGVTLISPHLEGDSVVVGDVAGENAEARRIPVQRISRIEAFEHSVAGTVHLTLIARTVAGMGFGLWLLSGTAS